MHVVYDPVSGLIRELADIAARLSIREISTKKRDRQRRPKREEAPTSQPGPPHALAAGRGLFQPTATRHV
jgi:hypothetical protein